MSQFQSLLPRLTSMRDSVASLSWHPAAIIRLEAVLSAILITVAIVLGTIGALSTIDIEMIIIVNIACLGGIVGLIHAMIQAVIYSTRRSR